MSRKYVKSVVDLSKPPKLTASQRAEIAALQARGDADIDTSDIPPLADDFWKNAIRNPFYKPTKTATTVRIDSDVLLWLRGQGRGYQTRLNEILRRAMLAALKP